jgi:hypothetical protein
MHMHGSQEEDFWVGKGKKIESQIGIRAYAGVEEREFAGEA